MFFCWYAISLEVGLFHAFAVEKYSEISENQATHYKRHTFYMISFISRFMTFCNTISLGHSPHVYYT